MATHSLAQTNPTRREEPRRGTIELLNGYPVNDIASAEAAMARHETFESLEEARRLEDYRLTDLAGKVEELGNAACAALAATFGAAEIHGERDAFTRGASTTVNHVVDLYGELDKLMDGYIAANRVCRVGREDVLNEDCGSASEITPIGVEA